MEIFSEWITQIILFILLGTIFELLLPDNSMKKYVNLILGLLLLLILAKPILYIFSVDVETVMKPVNQIIQEDGTTYLESENELKKQKKEIQATQDAYIWNEIAAQLKQEANDYLPQEHGQEITDLTLEHEDNDITAIICTLADAGDSENNQDRKIEQVEINTNIPMKRKHNKESTDEKLMKYLADIWETDSDIIYLNKEGGTN